MSYITFKHFTSRPEINITTKYASISSLLAVKSKMQESCLYSVLGICQHNSIACPMFVVQVDESKSFTPNQVYFRKCLSCLMVLGVNSSKHFHCELWFMFQSLSIKRTFHCLYYRYLSDIQKKILRLNRSTDGKHFHSSSSRNTLSSALLSYAGYTT